MWGQQRRRHTVPPRFFRPLLPNNQSVLRTKFCIQPVIVIPGSNVSATFLIHACQPPIVTCRREISPACCRGRPGSPKIEGEGHSRRQQQAAAAWCVQPPELIKQQQQKPPGSQSQLQSRQGRSADTQERFRKSRQGVSVCG